MNLSLRNFVASLAGATTLLLAACGGGGGGGGNAPPLASNPPVAVATATPSRAPVGTPVTLDGSGSSSPTGGTLSYQWSFSGKPEGSAAQLSSATGAKPTFTPDRPGYYVADLSVNDGRASAAARVTVTATSPDPVAIVTPQSQGVLMGSTVVLDGSASLPPTDVPASALRYQWTLTAQPDGEPRTTLSAATSAKASFTAGKVGIYRATLVVRHGDKATAPVEAVVTVSTGNSRPVAAIKAPPGASYNASGHLLVNAVKGQPFVLDGSASSDPDGDTLHYRWTFPTNGALPLGSNPVIGNASSAIAEFVPAIAGRYTIDFVVYDGSVSATQRVIVTVAKDPADTGNTAPVADFVFASGTTECELGGTSVFWPYCTASTQSYDADGDPLTYQWTYWNEATPNDRRTATGASLQLAGTPAARWHMELVASDGKVNSAPAVKTMTIKTGANRRPVAVATVDLAKVLVGESIAFDGSGSTDADQDQLGYRWTLTDRPDGSTAVLRNATSAQASVVADKPGLYTAFLEVTDSRGAVSPRVGTRTSISVFAKLKNNEPVVAKFWLGANSGTYEHAAPIESLVLTPVANRDDPYNGQSIVRVQVYATIFDPDLDRPLDFLLTATKHPAGITFPKSVSGTYDSEIIAKAPGDSGFVLTLPGDYEFEIIASDGVAASAPKRIAFTVTSRDQYQGLLLETGDAFQSSIDNYVNGGQTPWPADLARVRNFFYAPNYPGESATTRSYGVYRLTATDRDYTIADLQASSSDSSVRPYFIGLQDGQVLRKGQSVVFAAMRPAVPDEPDLATRLGLLAAQYGRDSAEYKSEEARLQKRYDDYRFSLSFRIAEKEGHTFSIGVGQ